MDPLKVSVGPDKEGRRRNVNFFKLDADGIK